MSHNMWYTIGTQIFLLLINNKPKMIPKTKTVIKPPEVKLATKVCV